MGIFSKGRHQPHMEAGNQQRLGRTGRAFVFGKTSQRLRRVRPVPPACGGRGDWLGRGALFAAVVPVSSSAKRIGGCAAGSARQARAEWREDSGESVRFRRPERPQSDSQGRWPGLSNRGVSGRDEPIFMPFRPVPCGHCPTLWHRDIP